MWWCDKCGDEIANLEGGWVEWHRPVDNSGPCSGPFLVHKRKGCQADPKSLVDRGRAVGDAELARFLGDDGLVHLASLGSSYRFDDERLRILICRLHVPGFEQAAHYYDEAHSAGVLEPNLPKPFMWAGQIAAVNNWVEAGCH